MLFRSEHEGVAVYHCYDDDNCVSAYWYTPDPADCNSKWPPGDTVQFDIRDLPLQGFDPEYPDHHPEIIRQAIEAGIVTGSPAEEAPPGPPEVLIAVKGGLVTVEKKPPGLRVEIVDYDAHAIYVDQE